MRHGIHSFGKPQENSELRPKEVWTWTQLVWCWCVQMYRCTGFLFGCVDHAKCPAGGVQLPRYVGFFCMLAISVRDASFQPEQVSSKLRKIIKFHAIWIISELFFPFSQILPNVNIISSLRQTRQWYAVGKLLCIGQGPKRCGPTSVCYSLLLLIGWQV